MARTGSGASGSFRTAKAAPPMLDSEMMSAEERFTEVARILAEGYRRLCRVRRHHSHTGTPTAGEKHLDSLGDQSDGCDGVNAQRRGGGG